MRTMSLLMAGAALLAASSLPVLAAEPAQLEVRALGNEAFALELGGRTVLFDALYRGLRGYVTPSAAERAAREEARAPYDTVALVLATHYHDDHFHPESVGRHLVANTTARLVTTEQAVERLRGAFADYEAIAARVQGVLPKEGERLALTVGGFELEVLNLHHGRSRRPPVQNLGFLLRMGEFTVLHVGDTEASADELGALGLAEHGIDVAFVPFWHLGDPAGAARYARALGARHIVPMHLPDPKAPASYFGRPGNLADLRAQLAEVHPSIVLLPELGAAHRFTPAQRGEDPAHGR